MTRLQLLLLAAASLLRCGNSFEVRSNLNGFIVTIGKRVFLEHTKDHPMLYAGKGQLDIKSDSGNFFIADKVESRLPLGEFQLEDKTSYWTVNLSLATAFVELRLTSSGNDDLQISVEKYSSDLTHFWFRFKAKTAEEIYGGGEQFSFLNLRERGPRNKNIYPIWVGEQGVGRDKRTLTTFLADTQFNDAGGDYYTTYFPQPTFVSSENYYCHLSGTNYIVFDFSEDTFHEVFIHGQPGTFTLHQSDSLSSTVKSLSSFLGHMPELPAWIQEKVIVSVQGGTKNLLEKFEIAEQNNIPISGVWVQDWSGQIATPFGTRVNWNWEWSPESYPGLNQTISDWMQKGVRVLVYINPNLNKDGNMFKEAAQKGYLVKNSKGDVYIRNSITLMFGQVDLTNPDAFTWYKNVIKTNLIELGLGGWMADFGEYLPTDAVMHDGRSGAELHNEWPVLWARCNREAVEEAGKLGEVVFFTRSGYSGVSNYSLLMWNGDQNVDFSLADGVRSTIYASLGAGMNGMTYSHFDVGGYTTQSRMNLVRSRELLFRSAEYAVFTSVFRTHEGNEIAPNQQWYDANNTADFAVQANNFAKLADYRKAVGKQSAAEGLPTMRLCSMVFPGDSAKLPQDQYMFGDDVMVAPVYTEGAVKRSVTFPTLSDGVNWIHIYTGETVEGGKKEEISAPLGTPPVYYRSDSTHKATLSKLRRTAGGGGGGGPDGPKDPDDGAVVG